MLVWSKEKIAMPPMFAVGLSFFLKESSVSNGVLEGCLKDIATEMKAMKDKESEEYKRLSYYAQLVHAANQSFNAALDIASALTLIMRQDGVFGDAIGKEVN